ncbi:MAG TPA: thiamine pyrophosphate-dependent enzyme [Polyangiales bacterium]|nr:thiamine pyrophosphate-dependent enzyme [Polyangiales bacterium]
MAAEAREVVDLAFIEAVLGFDSTPAPSDPAEAPWAPKRLTGERAVELFDSQLQSRHLDLAARYLRARGTGFYTIGGFGHEGNAAVAAALRVTDPALLHYRSGGFFAERARMHLALGHSDLDPVRAVLLGMVASSEDPISGGRHKVFGHAALHVIPQTSTIASHLPRAVGLALAMERAVKLRIASKYPEDAIVVCSFGDASANHSTAAGAINTACHCSHQQLPLPILFVCEDNGIGISVPTKSGWIGEAYGSRPGLSYYSADGLDLTDAFEVANEAASYVRETRRPAFLRLEMVRLMGHAGSDLETAYRRPEEIERDLQRDPLVQSARILVEAGLLTKEQVLERYEHKRSEVREAALWAEQRPRLTSAVQVMEHLSARHPERVQLEAARPPAPEQRARFFEAKLPEQEGPLTLALAINRCLLDLLAKYPELMVFGEDVGRKGGVYGVTRGLIKKAGPGRVFDTLLDEQSILGLGLGAGLAGLLPIPEIQYLAYLHNAEDQLRGEAATLSFFSSGQYRNPLVLRIASYGYQKGFGGHFHNDNALGVLRDIPGLIIASPSRPEDAAAMLRSCVAAARVDGNVCVYLEPIALYHTRDLHSEGDGAWLGTYTAPEDWGGQRAPIGEARSYLEGKDLTLVSYANGFYMSLRVAQRLQSEHGIRCRVLDLRWLSPLPIADLLREAEATGRVLIVDETRHSGSVSEALCAALMDARFHGKVRRLNSPDSFIPLGDAAFQVLLSEQTILDAALQLLRA